MALASPTHILNKVADSLVATQKYATVEEAFWEMAISTVRYKVAYYQRRLRKMEHKYKMDFDSFSVKLKGKATPAQEDDWLAWKSARRMLANWQKSYRKMKKKKEKETTR
jgi:hypothetical protein